MRGSFRYLGLAMLLSLLAGCRLFDYSSLAPKRFALVYGVTAYISPSDPNLTASNSPNLQYPDADAIAVATTLRSKDYSVVLRYVDATGKEWLQEPGQSNAANVGNLATDPSGTNGPSKANIPLDIAKYYSSAVGPNDLFLFYFSGHGGQDTSTGPAREYVIPEGAVQWDNYSKSYVFFPNPSVRDDELGTYLDVLQTDRKVVVLDTCNSGGFIGNRLESDALPPSYTGTAGITAAVVAAAIANYSSFPVSQTGTSPYNATVISAAGRDEFSYESGSPFFHGIMTYYFLETAASGDLNHDGSVTVNEAYSLIKAGIDQQWNADAGVIQDQETFSPHISGGPIDFVLF
jgi:hypothetical protein